MSPETVELLATQRVQLRAQIEQLQEAVDAIDEVLRNLPVGKHPAGPYTVAVQETKRLNTGRFHADHPPADYPELYRQVPDTTSIRKVYSETQLGGYMDVSTRLLVS